MLAYSSLTHVGYMVIGLGIAIYFHSTSAPAAASSICSATA